MKNEVIIIGSGLGGLACGLILAKNGYKVTILEQGSQIGGCLQCFRRGDATFETGMHFVGSAAEGQTLHRLLKYFDILNDIHLSQLDEKGYEVVQLAGERYQYANGRDAFIQQMLCYFPDSQSDLNRYFDIVETVAAASALNSLKPAGGIENAMQYQLRSIDDVLQETIKDEQLRNVLVGNLPLYAAEKGKTPFATHAFVMDFYNRSAYRIAGGSDTVATAMAKKIEGLGGRIVTNCKVTHIDFDAQNNATITIKEGKRGQEIVQNVGNAYIISAIHPTRTAEIVTSPLLRPAWKSRIKTLRNTIGAFTVYLKFKKNAVRYMNYNFYSYNKKTPWNCENYTQDTWPEGYLYMHMKQEPTAIDLQSDQNLQFSTSGIIISYMRFEEVSRWIGTTIGHRGADYEEFKQRKAEKLIERLCQDFPELRGNIERYYTSTPLTYLNYTGTAEGSMYGIAKDISATSNRVHHRTKVPNLLLSGQNINSHGILGVLVGAIVTCSEIIGQDEMTQQINRL